MGPNWSGGNENKPLYQQYPHYGSGYSSKGGEGPSRRGGHQRRAYGVRFVILLISLIALIFLLPLYLYLSSGRPHTPPPPQPRPLTLELQQQEPPKAVFKLGVIGGGPAGASVAHHVRQLAELNDILVHITIFEKSSHIGGRSIHEVQLFDDQNSGETIELAAADGFEATSQTLMTAATYLDLQPCPLDNENADILGRGKTSGSRAIFDSTKFVFTQELPGGWFWRILYYAKLLIFYGHSPSRTENLQSEIRKKHDQLYATSVRPFTSIGKAIESADLYEETIHAAGEYLTDRKISPAYQKDLLNPYSRKMYGQNLVSLTGFAAVTALEGGNAVSVLGGNKVLFESMVRGSGAEVRYNTNVHIMEKAYMNRWIVGSRPTSETLDGKDFTDSDLFDAVVLTAPWHYSGVRVQGTPLKNVPKERPYTSLHVTLFSSKAKISAPFFGIGSSWTIPEKILTTLEDSEFKDPIVAGGTGPRGQGSVGFFHIEYVKEASRVLRETPVYEESREHLYKIYSAEEMSDNRLAALCGGKDRVGWIYRHMWEYAHPHIQPTDHYDHISLDDNLWYTSPIDSLGSSMEMSAYMGENIAKIIVNQFSEELKTGSKTVTDTSSAGGNITEIVEEPKENNKMEQVDSI